MERLENNQKIELAKRWNPRPRYMGVVNSWYRDKSYGFIRCYEDGNNYFVHIKQVGEALIKGSIVEFEIWTNKREPDKKFAAKVLICEVPEERHGRH